WQWWRVRLAGWNCGASPAEADVEAESQVVAERRAVHAEDVLERQLRPGVKVVVRRPGRTDDDGNGPRLPWPRHEPVARGDGTLEHAADIQRDSLVRLEDELASQGVDPAIERRPSVDLVPDLGREDEGEPASPAHARDGTQDERDTLRAGLVSDVDRGRDL